MEYTARAPTGDGALSWAAGLADRIAPWAIGLMVFALSVISMPEWIDPVVLLAASAGMVTTWMARWRRWPLFVVAAASRP